MKTILKALFSAAAFTFAAANVSADEGMWLPSLISQRIEDMKAKGFRLDAEDIYSINQASLKDAVVLFNGGCTGEIISDKGLLLTNHHCGYGAIQKHSSVEHDYLKDGFWAMSMDEELPNEGLWVSFLVRMDDVTDEVLAGYDSSMSEKQRDSLVAANSSVLIEAASSEGPSYKASVESLYYGNQYFLFVYQVFNDVRLVGAPPSSIGKFGGDTDNWMWPRHTGDFSIFRVYADKDNNPAEYSEDNVPYTPKRFFKISTAGVKEGDFTFVYGFPGRTQEYLHSDAIAYVEKSNPHKIGLRTKRLDAQKKYMAMDQAVRIQYSSKNASVANAWKKWQGELKGILKLKTREQKLMFEETFNKWVGEDASRSAYSGLTDRLSSLYAELDPYMFALDYYNESLLSVEALKNALSASRITDGDKLSDYFRKFYKDYYQPIDKEIFVAMLKDFDENIQDEFKPAELNAALDSSSVEEIAESLYSETIFADAEKSAKYASADSAARKAMLDSDPAYIMVKGLVSAYEPIYLKVKELNREITLLYRDYMRGQMEFCSDKTFFPDANMTLRVAYGNVDGFSPADAVEYIPVSTIEGIIQKDNPEIFDYNIPQKLRDIYASKDYGRWNVGGTVPVCFLATNHTSGGNSGSPVIDGDGNLIGLNFDRVWEGTMSDLAFDPELCRNISVDIRYILFLIEQYAGATNLLDEMVLVE